MTNNSDHPEFHNALGFNIFKNKYAITPYETWRERSHAIVDAVCGRNNGTEANAIMGKDDRDFLSKCIEEMKFMPGGRYIYYAGREAKFYNNCYLLKLERDDREAWGEVAQRASHCLMTGGGIGTDVSIARPSGKPLSKTGGVSSGPIPLLNMINEIGRNVMQGGSRRSAMYGSLNWQHGDADVFLTSKNWSEMEVVPGLTFAAAKEQNFNASAPLDMTNISLNYDDEFLYQLEKGTLPQTFITNCRQAMMNGEPGFSFNFGDRQNETLRNACTEITSEDDSDVCNLGSVNLANVDNIDEFRDVVRVASKFLVCGTIRAGLPYDKVAKVREQNRRLGLGLMGMHEWLLKRNKPYVVDKEYKEWMKVYKDESERSANKHCDRLYLSRPKGYRAIAPTGTISMLACTTSGIEPIYATAYKRRYLTDGTRWKSEYVVDATADRLIQEGIKPEAIETAFALANDPERRIKFQYDTQVYIDHAISSTLNLPAWGTEGNNEDRVDDFAKIVAKYAKGLRGLTFYPDGSRGGQPITSVDYEEAVSKRGVVYEDNSEQQCLSGVCGI
jgi:ribonucleoside-diphosphate reductase alpha chain